MSVKEYNKSITIINATTGDVIDTIQIRNYTFETIKNMVNDIFYDDYTDKQHGILIKFGIKP